MAQESAAKLQAARTALILDDPFFGALAMRLALKQDTGCKTAWVDGTTLGYNPAFVAKLTHAELKALVAHEVMHCAAGHPWRRDARERKKWNEAADIAINHELTESGFKLPEGALMPNTDQSGKSAEWIYARMPEPPEGAGSGKGEPGASGGTQGPPQSDDAAGGQPDAQDGQSSGSPDPLGEVRDAPVEGAEDEASEHEWQQAVQQAAMQARQQGKLPAGLDRFATEVVKPRVDWRATLRRFVQQAAKSDYSWRRPNARYVASGIYLPAIFSEELGALAIAVDTSGSIDQHDLAMANAEIQSVFEEMQPARVHVFYADASVARADTFERGEQIVFKPAGGGGTDFRPVFEAIEAMEEKPVALVYITDMYGSFPEQEPEIPTLWVTATQDHPAPFGEMVQIVP